MALSREAAGERLRYGPTAIKRIENGSYASSLEHFVARWAEVFGLDDGLRALWVQVQAERSVACSPVSLSIGGEWTAEDADRLLNVVGSDGDSALDPSRAVRLAHEWAVLDPPQFVETTSGRRIGIGLVEKIEARTRQLRRLDDFLGGTDSHALVEQELHANLTLLRDSAYTAKTGRRLLVAVAELSQLAGWTLADAGQTTRAVRYYVSGVRAAHAADAPAVAANLVSSLSYLYANTGRKRDAVLLAHSAFTGTVGRVPPTIQALLQDRIAWAHARAGDRRQAERALGLAEGFFTDRKQADAPPWIYWLDRAELDVMSGRCWVELHAPEKAVSLLDGALAGYDKQRTRENALYMSWLAEAHLLAGEVDEAAHQALRVVRLAAQTASSRSRERVEALRSLLAPWRGGTQAVDEFEELCRDLVP